MSYKGSYSKWINRLTVIDKLPTMGIYQQMTARVGYNHLHTIDNELNSWYDRFGLKNHKITQAKVPELAVATAPYLSTSTAVQYGKLAAWLYFMDDLLFDNFNLGQKKKNQIVNNMLCAGGRDSDVTHESKPITSLLSMYDDLLSLPTIGHNQTVKQEICNYIEASLKECEMNSDSSAAVHYDDYLENRRFTAGTILCASYLTHEEEVVDPHLTNLHADIVILVNDLIGYDREKRDGEITTYPGLVKLHDNISDIAAQQKTYDLLLSKINQFEVLSNNIDHESQQFLACNAWIIGYYLHEKQCNRQQQ